MTVHKSATSLALPISIIALLAVAFLLTQHGAPPAPVSNNHLNAVVVDLQRQVKENTGAISADGKDILSIMTEEEHHAEAIAELEKRLSRIKAGKTDPRIVAILQQLHVIDGDLTDLYNRAGLLGGKR